MPLPGFIAGALQAKLDHVSRGVLRERAQAASEAYRAGGTSDVIGSDVDALAYAVVRMPATYAAVRASLAQTARMLPQFAPESLLDVGAGPGTATWAAVDAWPSLRRAHWIDRNEHLLALGRALHAASGARRMELSQTVGDIAAALDGAEQADVVVASYALAEIAPDANARMLARLRALAGTLLVLVEPGTPAGFGRILQCRAVLLEHGATIVAPCSHEGLCPLAAGERWCHFNTRLPRSRDHLIAKGADVPYEDEKFSYLVAGKGFGELNRCRRILATPRVTKAAVTMTLCAPAQTEELVIPRRQTDAYKAAKRLGWGDVC